MKWQFKNGARIEILWRNIEAGVTRELASAELCDSHLQFRRIIMNPFIFVIIDEKAE